MKVPSILRASGGGFSLGRSFLALMLGLAIGKFWFFGIEIPESMVTILISLMGYEMGKKGRDAYIRTKRQVGANPS